MVLSCFSFARCGMLLPLIWSCFCTSIPTGTPCLFQGALSISACSCSFVSLHIFVVTTVIMFCWNWLKSSHLGFTSIFGCPDLALVLFFFFYLSCHYLSCVAFYHYLSCVLFVATLCAARLFIYFPNVNINCLAIKRLTLPLYML
jgi:hypothetical protein